MIHDLTYLNARDNTLYIEDVSSAELAKQYGTPLYVYSKARILQNVERLKTAFAKNAVDLNLHYATKTNNNLAILHIMHGEKLGIDVSNGYEIDLARHAGFPPEKISYTGNSNPTEELAHSLKYVNKINLDDIAILPRLLKCGKPHTLSFRINPGATKTTIETNRFGGDDSKFGIDPETALYAFQEAKKRGVKKFGIHMMGGSCVVDAENLIKMAETLFDVAEMISKKAGIKFEFINIGGGLGIPYRPDEPLLNIDKMATGISDAFKATLKKGHVGQPTLDAEPGRYLVGDAGLILSRVHSIKKAKHTFIGTDAGMNTLIRPALHGSYHHIVCANKISAPTSTEVHICGRICESTDVHPGARAMPKLEEGDLLATLTAGAYGMTMASVFNTIPRAAEVLIDGDKHALIRKRETLEDLMRPMVVPQ